MTWETQLKESIRTIQEASSALGIEPSEKSRLKHVVERHLSVPPYYLSLMSRRSERPCKGNGRAQR